MRLLTLILVVLMSMAFIACDTDDTTAPEEEEPSALVINEFLASNDGPIEDEHGGFDDWVELYNRTDAAIDIGGMFLSDTPEDDAPWQVPTTDTSLTTIAAGGYVVIWCDDEVDQGVLHASFKLSGGGESVVLMDQDMIVVDTYTYEAQTTGVSWGRVEDGGDVWASFSTPTPGATNQ